MAGDYMEQSRRKPNRIPNYDYSLPNIYFITVCAKNRSNYFWRNSDMSAPEINSIHLSDYGLITEQVILDIPNYYPAVHIDNYTVMPNHIHLLLRITTDADGRPIAAPTISTVVNQMKGVITKKVGFPIWQKGFYDHIVRGESDYRAIYEYIDNNPAKWIDDELYNR